LIVSFIKRAENFGHILIEYFHLVALFSLFIAVIYMTGISFLEMISIGKITLKDVLKIFIYLEIGAMIGIYFKTQKLPVQFLIYIAVTALARVLTIDIKSMENCKILTITISIFILVVSATLLNRYNDDENCS